MDGSVRLILRRIWTWSALRSAPQTKPPPQQPPQPPPAATAASAAASSSGADDDPAPPPPKRLPPDLPGYQAEFVRGWGLKRQLQQLRESIHLSRSTFLFSLREFLTAGNMTGLLASTCLATGVGVLEGYEVVYAAAAAAAGAGGSTASLLDGVEVSAFAVAYGVEQLLASFAMTTTPAIDVAASYGFDATRSLLEAMLGAAPEETMDGWSLGHVLRPSSVAANQPAAAILDATAVSAGQQLSVAQLMNASADMGDSPAALQTAGGPLSTTTTATGEVSNVARQRAGQLATTAADFTAGSNLPLADPVLSASPTILSARHLGYLRVALTQVVILSQLLRMVNIGLRAREQFRSRVLSGSQPPVPFMSERVVRLCGEASDTVILSLKRYGRSHILPIFEDPERVAPLIRRISNEGNVPFFWTVKPNTYGLGESWRALVHGTFSPQMLIRREGKKLPVLYLEADATNAERSLAFASRSADLSVVDAAMGFRMLAQQARFCSRLRYVNYDVVRVFLGYPEERLVTGGGFSMSAGQALLEMGQCDVVIDARVPLLIRILHWVINIGAKEWHRTIVFSTDSKSSFEQMRDLLKPHGFHVVDALEPSRIVREYLPHLLYYRTTMETVHQVEILVRNKIVSADRICAVIDHADGLQPLNDLAAQGHKVTSICSAVIFDDMFRTVRCWVRQGFEPADIQRELNTRFSEVAELANEIARQHRLHERRRRSRMAADRRPSSEDRDEHEHEHEEEDGVHEEGAIDDETTKRREEDQPAHDRKKPKPAARKKTEEDEKNGGE